MSPKRDKTTLEMVTEIATAVGATVDDVTLRLWSRKLIWVAEAHLKGAAVPQVYVAEGTTIGEALENLIRVASNLSAPGTLVTVIESYKAES